MLQDHRTIGRVVLVAAVLWGGTAEAQLGGAGRRGGGRTGMPGGLPGIDRLFMIIATESVRMEIGLAGETADKFKRIGQEFVQDERAERDSAGFGPGLFDQLQGLPQQERYAKARELDEKRKAISKKLNEKYLRQIKKTLSSAQYERVRQIIWQAMGNRAFLAEPELALMLEMTNEQQEKINGISQELERNVQKLFGREARGAPPDPEAMRERIKKARGLVKEHDDKAVEVLTKEQQEKYAKLLGKSFDIAQLQAELDDPSQRGGGGRPRCKDDNEEPSSLSPEE